MAGITTDLEALSNAILDKGSVYDQTKRGYPGLDWLFGVKKTIGVGGMPQKALHVSEGTTQRYSDLEALNVSRHQGLAWARAPFWARYVNTALVSGPELAQAGGASPNVIMELGETRVYGSMKSMRNLLSSDLHTGTTATTSSMGLLGFATIFDTSASWLGIDPSTYTWWRTYNTTGDLGADYYKYMRDVMGVIRERGEATDKIFMHLNEFNVCQDLLAPEERRLIVEQDLKKPYMTQAGAQGIKIGQAIAWHDPDAVAAKIRGIVSSDFEFQVQEDYDMKREPWTNLRPYYDARATQFYCAGQIVASRRQIHWQISLS